MAAQPTQLLHGLRLSGEVAVAGAGDGEEQVADFEVRVDPPALPDQSAPTGELVAALDDPAVRYTASLKDDRLIVRFYATGEFEVDLRGGTIVARPAPGRGESMVPVLLAGNVLALVLGLRGSPVLHASAVQLDGVAVAFAGGTGAGKSTAAALLCSCGAVLVTDDAARVEERDEVLLIHSGTQELRLRPQAAVLANRVPGTTGVAVDQRVTVMTSAAPDPVTQLSAFVFPRWRHEAGDPSAMRLRPREALESLLSCPRVTGWQAPGPIQAHFDASARIAEALPVFDLQMPTGRLDDPSLAESLREALEAAGAFTPPVNVQ